MATSASSFLLPDAEPSWRLWKSLTSAKAEVVDTPAVCREGSKPVIIGLPATACRTVGLILPQVETGLLPSMIEAQLERRGIFIERAPTPNFAWHLVGHAPGQIHVSVDVLAHPFPADLALKHAANYTSALRLLALPAGELTVMEEQGLLVLAANHGGKLWHSHVLGGTDLSMLDLAREIEIARLSLEVQEGFGALRGVVLVGARLGGSAGELRRHLHQPVEAVGTLQPNRTQSLETFPKLLPAAVFEAQAAVARRHQAVRVAVLLALCFAVLCAFGWWYLGDLQRQAAGLELSAANTTGPASEVRSTAQRWRALEPAIDVERYPMVQLSHITNLLPPSGIVVKKFEAKPAEIELRGDARDAQSATQLLEDLKKHPKLSRFTWSMPTPSMKEKIATFRIQGKLEGS